MVTKEKVEQIINQIKETIRPDAIYLFGSYVAGKITPQSDLDICIIKNNVKNRQQTLFKIKKNLFEIEIPLDILLLNSSSLKKRGGIWGTVQYEIVHKGKKVYEK